jgi:hypothetical protein
VGGVFAQQNWWHVFFWADVPLALLAGAAALVARQPTAGRDTARLVAFAIGLTALTIAAVQGEVWSWGWSAALALVGALFLGRARLHELSGVALTWAALAGCLTALVFLLPEYFQLARNLSGSRSGVLLLALTLSALGGWTVSAWLRRRVPLTMGAASLVAGLVLLAMIDAHSRWVVLILAMGLTGLGIGVTAAARGTASGSLAAVLAGASLGLATAGGAFQIAQADERTSGASFEQALAAGVGWSALLLAVMLAAGALLIWRLRRGPTPASSAARPAAGS